MAHYVIATIKSWNIDNAKKLTVLCPEHDFTLIDNPDDLSVALLNRIRPRYVFFPHWSWIIPEDIYDKYDCVVFHMTDLPFGRGGSPLQNLIVRGIYETKISAIKVGKGIDDGPIYCKEDVDISIGNADNILAKCSDIVFNKMIPRFISEEMIPIPQDGEVTQFKRRKPEQSEIPQGITGRKLYDYIRMLDGEGYPKAYIDTHAGRLYLSDAAWDGQQLTAKVKFSISKE